MSNQTYTIIVWYRCVIDGEMEKDFIDYNINATNVQEAVNIVADKFKDRKAIPFSFEHEEQKYTPTNYNKSIFNN
jgi:hypothetical protein